MVGQERYNAHLKVAKEIKEVNIYSVNVLRSSTDSCRNGHVTNIKQIDKANILWQHILYRGIGGASCAWHGCWVPHSVVDFQQVFNKVKHRWFSLVVVLISGNEMEANKAYSQKKKDYCVCESLKHNMEGLWQAVL